MAGVLFVSRCVASACVVLGQNVAGNGDELGSAVSCIDAHLQYGVRLTLTPDPRVLGQPATALGMFGFVPCEGGGA